MTLEQMISSGWFATALTLIVVLCFSYITAVRVSRDKTRQLEAWVTLWATSEDRCADTRCLGKPDEPIHQVGTTVVGAHKFRTARLVVEHPELLHEVVWEDHKRHSRDWATADRRGR